MGFGGIEFKNPRGIIDFEAFYPDVPSKMRILEGLDPEITQKCGPVFQNSVWITKTRWGFWMCSSKTQTESSFLTHFGHMSQSKWRKRPNPCNVDQKPRFPREEEALSAQFHSVSNLGFFGFFGYLQGFWHLCLGFLGFLVFAGFLTKWPFFEECFAFILWGRFASKPINLLID